MTAGSLLRELEADQADSPLACTSHRASPDGDREGARGGEEDEDKAIQTRRVASDGADGGSTGCQQARQELIACAELSFGMLSRVLTAVAATTSAHPTTTTAVTPTTTSAEAASLRVRFHIIRNARIDNVGKSQSCMVSK